MKLRRRIGSVFLAFAMALSLIPSVAVSALAAEPGETVNRIRLMEKDSWNLATIQRAGYSTENVLWANVTEVRFFTDDGEYTNWGIAEELNCYSHEGYLATDSGTKISPSDIDRISVKLNFAYNGVQAGDIKYGVTAVFHKEDFETTYTEGAAGVREYAELSLKNGIDIPENQCAVTFMFQPIGATTWELYDIVYVNKGTSIGDNMPPTPDYGTFDFVSWQTNTDGSGTTLTSTTVINDSLTVYGTKTSAGGGTAYHVMRDSSNDRYLALQDELADLYNAHHQTTYGKGDVRVNTIQINGQGDESTNPIYHTNGWNADASYYYVYNLDAYAADLTPEDQNTRIPVDEVTGITATGTIDSYEFTLTIPKDELSLREVNNPGTSDTIIEISVREKLDDISKELITSESDVPADVTAEVTFPTEDNKVTIPKDGSVTLLYKITVTGDEKAEYRVTDTDATWVSGDQLTGTLDTDGEAVIYVTKTFTEATDGKLTNSATLTNDNDTLPPDDGKDEDSVIIEVVDGEEEPTLEEQTVYVYVQFIGKESSLSEEERDFVKETYGAFVDDNSAYVPIGTTKINLPDPISSEIIIGTDYFDQYLSDTFALTKEQVEWWEDTQETFPLSEVDWNKLSTATGARPFNTDDDPCWHLDGKITLSNIPQTPEYGELKDLIKVQVDCLTSNSWGEYAHQNKDYDLIEDSYTPGNVTLTDGTWTCTVSIRADKYVTAYNEEYGDHTLSSASPVNVTVVYKDNAWIRENANNNIAAVFDVKCAEPTIPSEDEIVDMFNDTGAVKVDCITSDVPHNSKGYALLKDSFKIGEPETKDNRLVLPITVTIGKYLEQYEEVYGEHAVSGSDTKTAYDVYWDGTQWTFDKDDLPLVDFDVKCIKPAVPSVDDIGDLFGDTGIVKVECIGDYVRHGHQTYAALDGTYTIGTEVVWQDGHWTIPITFTRDEYVAQYCEDTGVTHTGSGSATKTTHKVFWDGQKWTYDKEDLPLVVFDTKCSMPAAPGEEEITEILSGKDAVKVICQSTEAHQAKDKIYEKLLPNEDGKIRYEVGNVTPGSNDTFTLEITILPDVYVNQYNEDTKLTHWLTVDNSDQIVTLTWENGTWTAPDNAEGDAWATFEVTCLPEKPTYDDLTDDDDTGLLDGKDAVKVICVDGSHGAEVYKELWDNEDGKIRYMIGDVVRNANNPNLITCDVTILPEVYVNQYNTNTQMDHWLTDDTPQTITLTWDLEKQDWTAPNPEDWGKEAWAVFNVSCAAITITPADIVIYTGGTGYAGVTTNEEGVLLEDPTVSGLPEPGYHIELPDAVKAWLKNNGIDTDTDAANLADILDFAYNYDNETRSWDMTQAGIYDANAETGEPTRYVYTLDAAQVGDETIPVRILFKNGEKIVESDKIVMTADAAHANYTMTINPGELDQSQIKAVFTVGEGDEAKSITCNVNIGTGDLTVKSVVDNDPVNDIVKDGNSVDSNTLTAVADDDVKFYVNDSQVEVASDRVGLLVDSVSNSDEFNTDMEEDAISEVTGVSDAQAQSYYLDLVDTENGNAVVRPSGDVTIYWPMPKDADPSGDFYIVHYDEMDRQNVTDLQSDPTTIEAKVDGNHLTFTTDSFSPFVLVYEQKDSGGPVTPPVEDDDDDTPPSVNPNPPQLNTEDHYAYIVGYEDGTVRPEGDITRAEVATIFFRLLTDESRNEYWSQTNDYTDVAAGDWYNNAVSTLSKAGILNGYEDGSFQPNGNITRAEFATIAARFFEATYEGEDLFPDIKDHWARDYINQAAHAGIVNGYENGTFRPQENITRAEAMTIVNRTLDRHPDADHFLDNMVTWPDNLESAWYYEQVQEATNSHEYVMKTDADKNPYEIWKEILPVRDWSDLENTWSEAHAG